MSSSDSLFRSAHSSPAPTTLMDEKSHIYIKTEENNNLDADLYEETDECDLEKARNKVWLIKIPQFLQESWDDIPSDSEEQIELGTLMINKHDPNVAMILLSDDQIYNQGLPRAYNLRSLPKEQVNNTYMFTEKGTKRKRGNGCDGFPEIPSRLLYKKSRYDAAADTEDNGDPVFRKVEQNPTAVTGTVVEEMRMQPIQNAEYKEFVGKVQLVPKKKLKMDTLQDYARGNVLNPGTIGVAANKPFLKIGPSDTVRVKKLDKAFRISKGELQTKLFALFEKYEYYPTRFFIENLCQPELYLKEVLEEIAIYNTNGDFHGKWCLKSEYRKSMAK